MSIRVLRASFHKDKCEVTSQGFLRVPAYLTRTGVFLYRTQDGKVIRELRHPDDVFDPISLDSLRMAPLTNDHPKEMVTPENVKTLSVGWIGDEVKPDNNLISATAIVADKVAIGDVDKGKKELSCGYTADLVVESGTYNGEQYDVRQTNIRYNHVALVDEGRAGPQVRLRMDSADDAIEINDSINPTFKGEESMKKIIIDGKTYEVTQEVYDSIMKEREASKAKLDKKDEELEKKDEEIEKKDKELEKKDEDLKKKDEEKKKEEEKKDSIQARLDAVEEKLNSTSNSDAINKAVETRIAIEDAAKSVGLTDFKGKSNLDLMKETIVKHSPKFDAKDKSEAYVQARFDAVVEEIGSRNDRREQLSGKFTKTDSRKDDEFDSNAAREKAHADAKDGWKQPLAASKK